MRKTTNDELGRLSAEEYAAAPKCPVAVVLDNVRSMNNVGSFFRTCDALPVRHYGHASVARYSQDGVGGRTDRAVDVFRRYGRCRRRVEGRRVSHTVRRAGRGLGFARAMGSGIRNPVRAGIRQRGRRSAATRGRSVRRGRRDTSGRNQALAQRFRGGRHRAVGGLPPVAGAGRINRRKIARCRL